MKKMIASRTKSQALNSARQTSTLCGSLVRPLALKRCSPFQEDNRIGHSLRKTVCLATYAKAPEEEKVKLSTLDLDESLTLPSGYHWYETMMILNSTLSDEERDKELARFEAYLNKEDCQNINALIRGRTRMAYPMRGEWEGIYVLYTYAAKRNTAKNIQLLLSNPEAGSEGKLLRHITFFKF
ncbi:hypothetical protein CEUSTIGMA_g12241.t1 [Chlamydomonas eustigma]|uniref:Ribosomal protein S6 n=1 Tax=Chlamydomonas eustigma TaxID=1157962 RepID=A0A250XPU3_9CHLO|nr:hypothetical protein CEUSTIGMA_g12241.t1 [Chlamydomonas eustigma]|eukprot:GAX84820.1 hypothetical protein CEUSTIGMA_g12241.t1 [Chlamydomonas eustigma]